MNFTLIFISLGLLLLAGILFIWGGNLSAQTGLPAGRMIYSDTNEWFPQDEALVAEELQLIGKPDYLIQQDDGMIIPVEVKSHPAPRQPYDSHIMQVAAYCMLVWHSFGIRPSHAVLQYKDNGFEVDFTPELEADLLNLLDEMRQQMHINDVHRNHKQQKRCERCGVRDFCDQRLA